MTAWRNILILLTFIGGLTSSGQLGQAYPLDTAARQDVNAAEDGGGPVSEPVDPVIEEPLRPLYPAGGAFPSDGTPRCGSMGPLALLLVLLFICPVRFLRLRPVG
ncbi:MAG: hypothetical protein JSU86_02765 [Phycisphaerales bacterium]|nr:MAG: hypothetical protein JSU86_02765 [Phycisphaerales bacterium]